MAISVTSVGLLWDCSWCDTFNDQIIKGESRTCKEGTKQGSWQLTSLAIFLGWGLQASSCTPMRRNSGLMFDSDQIRRRAEHQASDRLSNLSLPRLFFPLTRLATDWQGYTLPGWQQSLQKEAKCFQKWVRLLSTYCNISVQSCILRCAFAMTLSLFLSLLPRYWKNKRTQRLLHRLQSPVGWDVGVLWARLWGHKHSLRWLLLWDGHL